MQYYLVDTCAYIYAIENEGKLKNDLIKKRALNQAFLYIPQFCIPEVLNTLARCFYEDKRYGKEKYEEYKESFLGAVRSGRIFYPYELHRYHNINADKIYETEHTTPLDKTEHHLSTFDILIIAMGIELSKIHGKNVFIVTRDRRLFNIGKKFVNVVWQH